MLITNATHRRWNREEYYRLAEIGIFGPDERVELIEGELIVMAPPSPEHSDSILYGTELLLQLYGSTHHLAVQLPLDLNQATQPQPDLALIAKNTVPRGQLPTSADLVIEVAFSTLAFDRKEKLAIYAKGQLPEYWIVDVVNRLVEVHRDPVALSATPGLFGYASRQIFQPEQSVQPLRIPGPACPLATFFS